MALLPYQYDEIMRDYDQIRLNNQALHQKRQAEVYEKIPGFQELDYQVASHSILAGKARLSGDSRAILNLHTDLHTLSSEKKRLLKAYGYPSDYLEPIYCCLIC